MYILGIACFYHDSSAAILKDGLLIAAAQEERWTRKKHDTSFPLNAIEYCLKEAGITANQLDCLAFYEKPLLKFERLLMSHLATFPKSLGTFVDALPSWFLEKLRVPSLLSRKLGYKRNIFYVEHHLAHAAGSFLASPFEEAAILTVDGVGEWATTTLGKGNCERIEILKQISFPHSLGLLYSTMTAYLGFKVNNDEYKVMGLAPYGKPRYYDRIRKLIDIKEDGSYRLDLRYFTYHYKGYMFSKKFIDLFGQARLKDGPIEEHHKDIAASLQVVLEEIYFKMLNYLHKITAMDKVCLSGGVALNSVANGKITKMTPFKKVYVPFAPSDAGSSVGAALAVWNMFLGNKNHHTLDNAYLGPAFDNRYLKNFFEEKSIVYKHFSDEDLVKTVAQLIWDNGVIGWFQGRMEFGERALGNRSILANPCNPQMKDILNLKVKHREQFRPFAPSVSQEDAGKYFDVDIDVPFMSFVYPVREKFREKLPAITHIDGSGRLQTVTKNQNRLYYQLIKEFEKLSSFPIVINTSFNIRGEPIVMTPEQAYRCFTGTSIDYLVIGNFIIDRNENKQHWWDSESLAKD